MFANKLDGVLLLPSARDVMRIRRILFHLARERNAATALWAFPLTNCSLITAGNYLEDSHWCFAALRYQSWPWMNSHLLSEWWYNKQWMTVKMKKREEHIFFSRLRKHSVWNFRVSQNRSVWTGWFTVQIKVGCGSSLAAGHPPFVNTWVYNPYVSQHRRETLNDLKAWRVLELFLLSWCLSWIMSYSAGSPAGGFCHAGWVQTAAANRLL